MKHFQSRMAVITSAGSGFGFAASRIGKTVGSIQVSAARVAQAAWHAAAG